MKQLCKNCLHYYRHPYGQSKTQHYHFFCKARVNKRSTVGFKRVKGLDTACEQFKTNNMTELQKNYTNACNAYLKAFCEKHNYEYDPNDWVCDEAGSVAWIGDLYAYMETIIYDVDNDVPEKEFIEWFDYTLRLSMINEEITTPNFKQWVKGCPRRSIEEISELEKLSIEVENARQRLIESIKSFKNE